MKINIGDKILDHKISQLNNRNVYAVVVSVGKIKFKCEALEPQDEEHYPHNFYYFEESVMWDVQR